MEQYSSARLFQRPELACSGHSNRLALETSVSVTQAERERFGREGRGSL